LGRAKVGLVPLVLLGLSHRTAPAEVRDRHTVPQARICDALRALGDYGAINEAAILSTCNRMEIYADVADFESGIAQIKEFLTTYRSMGVDDFDKYLYTMLGAEAVEQLFRVASGLDSLLVGEPQIMAQVKDALRLGEEVGSVGPHLARLFRVALQAGKRARATTAIGSDFVSLGAAAVEMARRHCDVAAASCVVVGAGKMGSIVAKHLSARGARSIVIANRTLKRAQAVAAELGAQAVGLEMLPDIVHHCDLLITAVGRGSLITADMLQSVGAACRPQPLLIIDIGVPRDVEPAATHLPGVVLYALEDLREVIDQTLSGRRAQIPAVEEIVSAHVGEYIRWYRTRGAAPLIASLKEKAEQIRSAEIEKLFARIPELDEHQRQLVIATSVSMINKLLHAPVTKLRESAARSEAVDEAALVQTLLDVDAFSDRLQRQLDARTAPLFTNAKDA